MIDSFTVQHFEYATSQPFEQVIAAFEAVTGDISGGRFERELAASKDVEDFERRIHGYEAESGFMRFLMLDHGAWSALYGAPWKSRLYTLGNPLIAHTMMKHDLAVGLNVPVRVLIYEAAAGETKLGYDLPSSLMSRLDNAEVTAAARKLDAKLATLAERVMGEKGVMASPSMIKSARRFAVAAGAFALAGLAASPASSQNSPWGPPGDAAYKPFDVTYQNYHFRDGETLASLRVHYLTLGTPHRDAQGQIDNAVLVLHWTSADSKAVTTQAYTKSLYDAGRPLDASRYFLIFPDAIGCGLTSKPSNGLRAMFPNYGYGDMVDIQHKLVAETLGIKHLHAILGMSMGGMNAWQWAEAYPDEMDGVMPVVSLPTKVSGRNAIWRHLAIDLIRDDPGYQGGNYTAPLTGTARAYALLRMMIDGVAHLQTVAPNGDGAETFVSQIATQSRGIDPNDVLYSLKSSGDYDPEPNLSAIRTKLFALNFDDDEFNPDRLGILERLTPTIPGAHYVVQKGTPTSFGHLTMAHPELWAQHVGAFMRELDGAKPASPPHT